MRNHSYIQVAHACMSYFLKGHDLLESRVFLWFNIPYLFYMSKQRSQNDRFSRLILWNEMWIEGTGDGMAWRGQAEVSGGEITDGNKTLSCSLLGAENRQNLCPCWQHWYHTFAPDVTNSFSSIYKRKIKTDTCFISHFFSTRVTIPLILFYLKVLLLNHTAVSYQPPQWFHSHIFTISLAGHIPAMRLFWQLGRKASFQANFQTSTYISG